MKRFRLPLLLGLALVPALPRAARAQEARNLAYFEAAGNAVYIGSVNYERMITPGLSARVGASPFGSFPVMLNYLVGAAENRGEVGFGALLGANDGAMATASLGYRYQPRVRGTVFRVTWTPLVGPEGIATWFGVSVGTVF